MALQTACSPRPLHGAGDLGKRQKRDSRETHCGGGQITFEKRRNEAISLSTSTTPTPAPSLCCFYWRNRNEGSSQVGVARCGHSNDRTLFNRYSGVLQPQKDPRGAPCMPFQSFVIALFVIRCSESLWSRPLDRVVSSAGVPHGHYSTLFQNTTHAAQIVPRHALASSEQ